MKLLPIPKIGSSRTGILRTTYAEILEKVFSPNATKLDDPGKVKASWGFVDEKGREGFIWCYKHYGKPETCTSWSVDGDITLLKEIFGNDVSFN